MGDMGILVLFPASSAAKVDNFFSVFSMETSSIFTITTVPWVCARLFARMRSWLQGQSGVGTATNELLFSPGKTEQRSVGRWRGVAVCPHCWGARPHGSGSTGGKTWAESATCMPD